MKLFGIVHSPKQGKRNLGIFISQICCSDHCFSFPELHSVFLYPGGPPEFRGDYVASCDQWSVQVHVSEPAAFPHPAGVHDVLRSRHTDAHTYGHTQVCSRSVWPAHRCPYLWSHSGMLNTYIKIVVGFYCVMTNQEKLYQLELP